MRSFTIDSIVTTSGLKVGYTDGRFISNRPSSAARKVFTKVLQNDTTQYKTLIINVKETTRGSMNKMFTYSVSRLNTPITVNRNGMDITFKFSTKVKSHQ